MFRFAVPGMVNEFTSVLKYSPFAYTVGIPEITKQAMSLTATTLRGIENLSGRGNPVFRNLPGSPYRCPLA